MTREECLCVNQQTIFLCQYPKGGYVFFPLKDVTVFDYLFDAKRKGCLEICFFFGPRENLQLSINPQKIMSFFESDLCGISEFT